MPPDRPNPEPAGAALVVAGRDRLPPEPGEEPLIPRPGPRLGRADRAPVGGECDSGPQWASGGRLVRRGGCGGRRAGRPLRELAGARRGLLRLALLLVVTLRVPQDVARGIWTLPAKFRAFRQLQDGLLELTDEDMLDRCFGAVGHESEEFSVVKVRPCRTRF